MKAPPPPPPSTATRMPPPPPQRRSAGGGVRVTVNPCMSPMSLTEAVFTIGDYPQVPWGEAVDNFKRRIAANGWSEINPLTIWVAERKRRMELVKEAKAKGAERGAAE